MEYVSHTKTLSTTRQEAIFQLPTSSIAVSTLAAFTCSLAIMLLSAKRIPSPGNSFSLRPTPELRTPPHFRAQRWPRPGVRQSSLTLRCAAPSHR
jgi:hypothetical protein